MSATVLLTGATGFLGTRLAERLLDETGHTLVVLVRAPDREAAVARLARAWWDEGRLRQAVGKRIEVLCGDVSLPRLGLSQAEYDGLSRRLTHVIHAAADLRLHAPLEELRAVNAGGTANILELARAAHRDHGLARFSHVSTAYVAGGRTGEVAEADLSDAFGFAGAYEQSKYEGEVLARRAMAELPVSVFRPGMVAGDSNSGAIKTFNTMYYPLRLYLTGRLRLVPASPALRVNFVPVDYVAGAVARLTFAPEAVGLTFHLTAPPESLPTVRQLVEAVRGWARQHLGVSLPRPLYLPLPLPAALRRAGRERRGLLANMAALSPYFNERRRFRRDNSDRLLGPYPVDWRRALPPMLEYAARMGFLHRSERTVQEQVLFRLASKSRPVVYHDIVDGNVVSRTAAEVRGDMLRAAAALRAVGVRPGDRVALVGLNSSRYLTLDVAIGLIGAVSVPLYYTSPPAEIDAILAAAGASLLLVGAPRVLERLGELTASLPVVSFCREAPPAALAGRVVPWEEFLAKGEAGEAAPVLAGPDDLATLRYTSGTTGQPRGVAFTHAHLRWMAECIAALLPWRARHRGNTWLSFLPMNHVVEGILGTYAPYYVPAPIEVYFLEDFRGLQQALPLARPTVFFSVPRFYERLWEGLLRTGLGRAYAASPTSLRGRLLRPLLRRLLLRRAGLDRCLQLIAGSAPSSRDLVDNFRRLGIEVHDAYGLTEAPLVTINRLGANRVGTVGEPLPETEVAIAEDGEVLVRGPQVMRGYFQDDGPPPFRDGWLLTGDYGQLTDEGSLVLLGRKKELIATAYGKKVHPAKVEALLRDIAGVAEAMLVGEERPYCAALLWLQEGADVAAVDRDVLAANARLSHPEQVKRWALLANDLSIEGGELTANLKLKRRVVLERRREVVAALYGGPLPEGVLHLGAAPAQSGPA